MDIRIAQSIQLAGNLVSDGEGDRRYFVACFHESDATFRRRYQRDFASAGRPFSRRRVFQGDVPVAGELDSPDGYDDTDVNPDERLLVRVYGPGPDSFPAINGEGVLLDNVEWSVTFRQDYLRLQFWSVVQGGSRAPHWWTGSSPSESGSARKQRPSLVRQIQVSGNEGEAVLRLP